MNPLGECMMLVQYMSYMEVMNAKKTGIPIKLWIGEQQVEVGVIDQFTEEFMKVNGNIYLTRMVSVTPVEPLINRKSLQSVNGE
jgi:hypothetical protein